MKRAIAVVFGVVVVVLMGGFASAQQDKKGCKDHPLVYSNAEFLHL